MENNFNLRKFLTENKLTSNSRLINEELENDILQYIADTYIQNAKDGDKAYAEFRDLNIGDAVQDVVGILQDTNHPLHDETKKEYSIVRRDKEKGLFEKAVINEDDVEDGNYPVIKAFRKAGIDMSKDVHVHETDGGTAGLGGGQLQDEGVKSAKEAADDFEFLRQQEIKDYENSRSDREDQYGDRVDDMGDFPVQYEYAYFGDDIPEGKEFKMSFTIFEGTAYDIFQ